MKRYLWVGGLVLAMNAYSADNPFDLAKNMQKIEAEDTLLLDTLEDEAKSIKKENDIKTDDFVVSKPKPKQNEPKEQELDIGDTQEVEVKNQVVKTEPTAQETTTQEKKLEEIVKAQQPQETVKEVAPQESKNVETVKIDKEPIVKQPIVKEKEQQKPKVVQPKETPQKVVTKQEDVKKEQQVQPKVVQPKIETTKSVELQENTKTSIVDINLTKEREELAKRLQQELEEAIKDVDRED